MNDVPLIKTNSINDINTSLIAIKKQLKQLNEALGLVDFSGIDTPVFVKKSDVVDVVESGNLNPVTSNAVANAIENIPTASYSESSTGFNANFGTGYCFSRRLGKLCIISININSTILAMAQDSIFCFIPEESLT